MSRFGFRVASGMNRIPLAMLHLSPSAGGISRPLRKLAKSMLGIAELAHIPG